MSFIFTKNAAKTQLLLFITLRNKSANANVFTKQLEERISSRLMVSILKLVELEVNGTLIQLKENVRVIRRLEMDLGVLINSGEFLKPFMLLVYTKLWTKQFKLMIKNALEPVLSQLTQLLIVILSAIQSIPKKLQKRS